MSLQDINESIEYQPTEGDVYEYKMSNTGAGSSKYGACEVCKKEAETIYLQSKKTKSGVYISSTFGHKVCLEGIQNRD